jgi:hypothetical protein
MPISQMSGVQLDIPELPRLAPLRNVKNYDDFLTRLEAYPRYVDQVIELMKRGITAGWVPPAIALRKVPPQPTKQLAQDVKQSPLYKPFASFPAAIGPGERSRLEARGLETIKRSIVPALERLNYFIAETYLPCCRKDIAATQLPVTCENGARSSPRIRGKTASDFAGRCKVIQRMLTTLSLDPFKSGLAGTRAGPGRCPPAATMRPSGNSERGEPHDERDRGGLRD